MQKRNFCPMCKTYFGEYLIPMDENSQEALKDYKPYQPLRNRITAISGSEKRRSLKQLNTYWAACQFVADNIDTKEYRYWKSKESVDFQLRVATDFRDKNFLAVRPDGEVVFKYRSIAMKNLKHIEACRYFDQAFELMTHVLGYKTVDEFIAAVKKSMVGTQ